MNRKRLILGILIATLFILTLSGIIWFKGRQNAQADVYRRSPLQRLGYCGSDEVRPCIVSFSLDSDGKMLVSLLTTGAFYPDFYLKIEQGDEGHIYSCQKVNKFATSVYCVGAALPVGQVLQFSLFSIKEEVLLAEGDFAIIGLALGTPEIGAIPTLGTPLTPSPTEGLVLQTPTFVLSTPTKTPTPSYPNYP